MTYNLLTVGLQQPIHISAALAACLRVEPSAVDVADRDGDQEDRNWDALALCDYGRVPGDVSLSLDVYVQEAVADPPSEAEFCLRFAAAARTVVLYPAEELIPSAYWLVTPAGLVTRARLVASDDERPVHSVDAVEAPVPELPAVRVMRLPEIVREHPVPTPGTHAGPAIAEDAGLQDHSRGHLAE